MRILFPRRILGKERHYVKCIDASNFHGKHFQLFFRGVILALRDAGWSCTRGAARENANAIARFVIQFKTVFQDICCQEYTAVTKTFQGWALRLKKVQIGDFRGLRD